MIRACGIMLLLMAAVACPLPAFGQELNYVRKNRFGIPFDVDPQDRARLKEVQLYLSDDQGRSWRIHRVASPADREFPFQAERDGQYWFIIRTLSVDNQLQPASLDGRGPDLRVVVDTRPPQIILQALPAQGDLVGVSWEVIDENLLVGSLVLECRPVGGDWREVEIEKTATGRKFWNGGGRGDLDVRLRARDRAENSNTGFTSLRGGRAMGGEAGYESNPNRSAPTSGLPNVLYVNHTDIQFKFQLEEVGPSGISGVDLYYTKDGPNWRKYGEDPSKEPPLSIQELGENVRVIKARLPADGHFGVIMVPRSGAGLSGPPPQRGDRPMLWVVVDTTKPKVNSLAATAARAADGGTVLNVQWSATDQYLDAQPISLFYSQQKDGPWELMEKGLDNTGRYQWRVPQGVPFRFFVRLEARDKANNIGQAITDKEVIVDLTQPKIRLLGVEPATGGSGGSLSVVPPGQ